MTTILLFLLAYALGVASLVAWVVWRMFFSKPYRGL